MTTATNAEIYPESIPHELRELPQWVEWATKVRNDKPTKIPFQTNGTEARSNDPTTWTSFSKACQHRNGHDGIGFVFSTDDPFCGIDLDGCRDPVTGRIAAWAQRWIDLFNSYAEVSPSQTGVKIFVRAKSPMSRGKNKKLPDVERVCDKVPGVELYDKRRYFAITGQRLPDAPVRLEERQDVVELLAETYWECHSRATQQSEPQDRQPTGDPRIIERARKYLATVDPAVSGQGGHNQLFRAACRLVIGFSLSAEDSFKLLKTDYNPRCKPPWSDAELWHKVEDADKEAGERGHLLNGTPAQSSQQQQADAVSREPFDAEPIEEVVATRELREDSTLPKVLLYKSFPVDELPAPLRCLVEDASDCYECDPAYFILPALSILAGAIGTTRQLRLSSTWRAPSILWTGVVAPSATMKTPAARLMTGPARDRQNMLKREQEADDDHHEIALQRYNQQLAKWKKQAGTAGPPLRPKRPRLRKVTVKNFTLESLVMLLKDNPRGLTVLANELAGWIGSFDRYAEKGGGDCPHYLEMYDGDEITYDRKTGQERSVHVSLVALSITGGIQPGILKRTMSQEFRDAGLLARFGLACPPDIRRTVTEKEISVDVLSEYEFMYDRLYELEHAADHHGQPHPIELPLSMDAKAAWLDYRREHHDQLADIEEDDLRAAWGKLEETAARLALVVHCCRWASRDPTLQNPDAVGLASMEAGIRMARWFRYEAGRIYELLVEPAEVRDHRRALQWIARQASGVTAYMLSRGPKPYRGNVKESDRVLRALAKAGYGEYRIDDHDAGRGRPTERFFIYPA